MKKNRYIAKWFIVILIMAIGIGTFGALTVRNEKQKEENDARPESYITNQRKHDIDMTELAKLAGDFASDGWTLTIYEDKGDMGPYLAMKEGSEGRSGFEGRIMYLKDGIIIVEIDEDLFEGLPDGWEADGKGKGDVRYAILDITASDNGLTLGYRGDEIVFSAE